MTARLMALAVVIVATGAGTSAFAAGKPGARGVQADGTTCAFSVASPAAPAARCAAIKKQCGGKFYAAYCGDRLLSAM